MIHLFGKYKLWIIGLTSTSLVITGCSLAKGPALSEIDDGAEVANAITVFRSPTCGCCSLWIDHMEASGFQVKDEVTEDMAAIKQQYEVPANLRSCHTTVANDYVLEGHIPAADVQRLLIEKPDVVGIAVPGMPIGSPGMESGSYVEPYTVFSFDENGTPSIFSEHS